MVVVCPNRCAFNPKQQQMWQISLAEFRGRLWGEKQLLPQVTLPLSRALYTRIGRSALVSAMDAQAANGVYWLCSIRLWAVQTGDTASDRHVAKR
jgi:hypothetical protein